MEDWGSCRARTEADWLKDHVRRLRAEGVDILVSLLPVREAAYLDLLEEAAVCEVNGIICLSFPIEDRAAPGCQAEVTAICRKACKRARQGQRGCNTLPGRYRALFLNRRQCAGQEWDDERPGLRPDTRGPRVRRS